MTRGFDHPLYLMPFDHRGSFQTGLFGWKPPLSDAQTAEITRSNRIISDGFQATLAGGAKSHGSRHRLSGREESWA